jgi:hypothetical protein
MRVIMLGKAGADEGARRAAEACPASSAWPRCARTALVVRHAVRGAGASAVLGPASSNNEPSVRASEAPAPGDELLSLMLRAGAPPARRFSEVAAAATARVCVAHDGARAGRRVVVAHAARGRASGAQALLSRRGRDRSRMRSLRRRGVRRLARASRATRCRPRRWRHARSRATRAARAASLQHDQWLGRSSEALHAPACPRRDTDVVSDSERQRATGLAGASGEGPAGIGTEQSASEGDGVRAGAGGLRGDPHGRKRAAGWASVNGRREGEC